MVTISIIVPVYNTENELERCIESLLNQTQEDISITDKISIFWNTGRKALQR